MTDALLTLLYATAVAVCHPAARQQAMACALSFAVVSAVATLVQSIPPWAGYVAVWAACVGWLAVMLAQASLLPAAAVGGLAVYQVVMAVDALLIPHDGSPLHQSYPVVAGVLNLAIILATVWTGSHGDRWLYHRRRGDSVNHQDREVVR